MQRRHLLFCSSSWEPGLLCHLMCYSFARLGTHRLEDQHAIVWREKLCHEQLEELFLHASRIDAVLPNEVYP